MLGFLDGTLGWRMTCFVLAAVQLLVSAPFHWWLLQGEPERAGKPAAAPLPSDGIAASRRGLAMLLLIPSMCLSGFISWGLSVHLVDLLRHIGAEPAEAIWLASLLGVLQVSGRVIDLVSGSRHSPLVTGMMAAAMLSASFAIALLPVFSSPTLAFMLVYGVGSGAMSLARVMIPLALFGTRSYGRASGVLAAFQNVAFAVAPLFYAALFARAGTAYVLWLSFVAGMLALLGMTALYYLRR
jgi:predicted MFS family arabinose efflux permease